MRIRCLFYQEEWRRRFEKEISFGLEVTQQTKNLIDPACKVWRDFGVQRSGRRWFTSEWANKVFYLKE